VEVSGLGNPSEAHIIQSEGKLSDKLKTKLNTRYYTFYWSRASFFIFSEHVKKNVKVVITLQGFPGKPSKFDIVAQLQLNTAPFIER